MGLVSLSGMVEIHVHVCVQVKLIELILIFPHGNCFTAYSNEFGSLKQSKFGLN